MPRNITIVLALVVAACGTVDTTEELEDGSTDPNTAVINCEHNPCEEGAPLWSTCQPCVVDICDDHPKCCDGTAVIGDPAPPYWDEDCANAALELCTCGEEF